MYFCVWIDFFVVGFYRVGNNGTRRDTIWVFVLLFYRFAERRVCGCRKERNKTKTCQHGIFVVWRWWWWWDKKNNIRCDLAATHWFHVRLSSSHSMMINSTVTRLRPSSTKISFFFSPLPLLRVIRSVFLVFSQWLHTDCQSGSKRTNAKKWQKSRQYENWERDYARTRLWCAAIGQWECPTKKQIVCRLVRRGQATNERVEQIWNQLTRWQWIENGVWMEEIGHVKCWTMEITCKMQRFDLRWRHMLTHVGLIDFNFVFSFVLRPMISPVDSTNFMRWYMCHSNVWRRQREGFL